MSHSATGYSSMIAAVGAMEQTFNEHYAIRCFAKSKSLAEYAQCSEGNA